MSLFNELKRRNVIRVAIAYLLLGWVVLQGADFALDLIGAPDWVIRALAIVALVGLPFALAFSWAFEMTPEGIKREAEVNRDESIAPATGQKLNGMIIALLVLAVALLLIDRYRAPRIEQPITGKPSVSPDSVSPDISTDTAAPGNSVAVLPFRAMSSGEDDEYFADGLTEEILNSLAQVPGLSVTSRTSAFYFKDKDLPIRDIAERLNVKHVVEGSVRRSGDRLRVTAQLIRADDDTHLWSNTYDRTDADAIAVQEDIAQRIAETLNVFLDENTLAQMRRAGIRDVHAFIEYARGVKMQHAAHGSDAQLEELAQANTHLAAAVEAAPGFARAWQDYSDYYTHVLIDSAIGELSPKPTDDELQAAYAETQRAFQQAARHATNPGARAAAELDLAIIRGESGNWRPLLETALASETCIELIWAHLIAYLPEFSDQFGTLLERLIQCDPMASDNWGELADNLISQGQPARALERLDAAFVVGDEFLNLSRINALVALGEFETAESVAAIDLANEGSRYKARMEIAAARGDLEGVLASGDALAREQLMNEYLALLQAAWTGDRDTANAIAGRIDAQPLGHMALMVSMLWCQCGAPFDLDAAPRFADMWRQAEFPWPLPAAIDFPMKEW
ncbi:hypothetical protein F3N42_08470 [Marinihelvus fidelis]|uniref:FlgO domain-containing protein n=1 Tax=Marinihelvus fidelis TaxID=2613842 RepID=A0A5N0TB24_9GAMM|nr:hypothetical protein [Marinihelvus fidelis]KAA9131347.1 hypothetical protein F3N42_08470 [Marinihelvus fidelis]